MKAAPRLAILLANGQEKPLKAEQLVFTDADGARIMLQLDDAHGLVLQSLPLHPLLIQPLASNQIAVRNPALPATTVASALDLTVQYAIRPKHAPGRKTLRRWAHAALMAGLDARITLRIVDSEEMQALNHQFCGKDYATNVLSFPYDVSIDPASLLGDIVLCAPVIAREAKAQDKPVEAHWAHLLVHGLLHLQGHDHQDDSEADAMETLEAAILHQLGFADPYAAERTADEQAADAQAPAQASDPQPAKAAPTA